MALDPFTAIAVAKFLVDTAMRIAEKKKKSGEYTPEQYAAVRKARDEMYAEDYWQPDDEEVS